MFCFYCEKLFPMRVRMLSIATNALVGERIQLPHLDTCGTFSSEKLAYRNHKFSHAGTIALCSLVYTQQTRACIPQFALGEFKYIYT